MSRRGIAPALGALSLLLTSHASGQPIRCKPPKQPYEGVCRYQDEISALKNAKAKPAPAPKPIAPKPIAPKPVAPKPVAPKPVAPKPVAPKPVAPKPAAARTNTSHTLGATTAPVTAAPWRWQHSVAVTAGGLSLAGIGIGTGLVVMAIDAYDDSEPGCPNNVCATQTDLNLREQAFSRAQGAEIAYGLSAGLAAAGLTLWLLAPNEPTTPSVALVPSASHRGVTLVGQW